MPADEEFDFDAVMTDVESSNLAAVAYDSGSQELYIRFHYNNMVYRYDDVPDEIYKGLMSASSKGQYFAFNIRDRFTFTIVS